MSERKLNTNAEQIRLESVIQANMNAAPGTPIKMILADALVVEEFIKDGPNPEIMMMRQVRDQIDQDDIRAYMGIARSDETTSSEEVYVGDEPVVVREDVNRVVDDEARAQASSADIQLMREQATVSSPESRGEVSAPPVIIDEADGVILDESGPVDREIHVPKPDEAVQKTAFQKYQEEGLSNG